MKKKTISLVILLVMTSVIPMTCFAQGNPMPIEIPISEPLGSYDEIIELGPREQYLFYPINFINISLINDPTIFPSDRVKYFALKIEWENYEPTTQKLILLVDREKEINLWGYFSMEGRCINETHLEIEVYYYCEYGYRSYSYITAIDSFNLELWFKNCDTIRTVKLPFGEMIYFWDSFGGGGQANPFWWWPDTKSGVTTFAIIIIFPTIFLVVSVKKTINFIKDKQKEKRKLKGGEKNG